MKLQESEHRKWRKDTEHRWRQGLGLGGQTVPTLTCIQEQGACAAPRGLFCKEQGAKTALS